MAKSWAAVEGRRAPTCAENENGPRRAGRFFGSNAAVDQNVYFTVAIIDQRETTRLGS